MDDIILDPGVWCFTMHGTVWVSTYMARYWDHLVVTENLHFAIQPPPETTTDDYAQIGTIPANAEAP